MILDNSLNHYFFQLYKKNMQFLQQKTNEEDIALGQVLCLHEIYINEGLSQGALASKLTVDGATITRAMKVMMEKGYVHRERNAIDRRAYGIYLTEKGRNEYENVSKYFLELENNLCEVLTDMEKMALLHLLEKICSSPKMNQFLD